MWEIFAQIIVISTFVGMFLILPKKNLDVTGYSLFFAIIGFLTCFFIYPNEISQISDSIPLNTLVYLLGMNILIVMMDQQHIFHYIAIQIIHITRSNPRRFFYVICVVSALFSGVMEDVTVTIIFIPLILRATKILKINSSPYIIGTTLAITIGNLLTPFSSASIIILSDLFGLKIDFYILQLGFYFLTLLSLTIIYLDYKQVKNLPPPTEWKKSVLLEIMNPKLIIKERSKFVRYFTYFITVLITLMFVSPSYLVITIAILIITLVERDGISNYFEKVDWKFLFFLLALFIMIGCMSVTGVMDAIQQYLEPILQVNLLVSAIIVLFISAILVSFTSRTMIIVLFYSMFGNLFVDTFISPTHQQFLIVALVIGAVIGGNLVPQASSHMLKTLDMCQNEKDSDFNFKTMFRSTLAFSVIALAIAMVYLLIYYLIFI